MHSFGILYLRSCKIFKCKQWEFSLTSSLFYLNRLNLSRILEQQKSHRELDMSLHKKEGWKMSSGVVSTEMRKNEQQQLMKSTPSSEFHVEMFHLGSSTAGLRRFLKERILVPRPHGWMWVGHALGKHSPEQCWHSRDSQESHAGVRPCLSWDRAQPSSRSCGTRAVTWVAVSLSQQECPSARAQERGWLH